MRESSSSGSSSSGSGSGSGSSSSSGSSSRQLFPFSLLFLPSQSLVPGPWSLPVVPAFLFLLTSSFF